MALEGPRLVYMRKEEDLAPSRPKGEAAGSLVLQPLGAEEVLARALRLAREVEELLEQAPSVAAGRDPRGAHSTRIVRAMAASLVDELEAMTRGTRKGGLS